MKNITFLTIVLLLSSCNPVSKYKAGGFGAVGGGIPGSASALVTISGKVMSSAAFSGSSSLTIGKMGRTNYIAQKKETLLGFEPEGSYIENVCADNPCASASWNLKYVGSNSTVATGISNCGDFTIPSIPAGKEGVVTFTCSNGTQRCLTKAGDNGLNCNAVADAVVGALEVSLDAPLTSTALAGKTIAKVATSIVESTNTDSSDAEELKAAIETCKGLADAAAKKSCYKDTFDSSNQAGTLSVVKTLAQTWTVSNLFNFMIGTAGFTIEMDDFIYTPFGEAIDDWFSGPFIADTKAFIADLIQNPEYIQGDPTKGQQQLKIECTMSYSKYQSGGKTAYKPAIVGGKPSCANAAEIAAMTGLNTNDPKVTAFMTYITSGDNHGQFQFGNPVDANGNPVDYIADDAGDPKTSDPDFNCTTNWNNVARGNFCVWPPQMVIKSKYTEPDRNDPSGEMSHYTEETRISLINVFPAAMAKLLEMQAISNNAGPLFHCVQGMENDGAPSFNLADATCKSWLKTNMSALKTEFSGLIGLFYYLNQPTIYKAAGSGKLSLEDIHKIFTRIDFMSSRMTDVSWGEYSGKSLALGNQANPLIDFSTTTIPFIPDLFKYNSPTFNNPLNNNDYAALLTNSSLVNEYNRTFKMFETIPNNKTLQTFVQTSSHHADYNPLGSKYNQVLAAKKANATDTSYPLFCRLVNKNTGLPMLKELNSESKVECLADPAGAGVVATATEGLFTVPAGFNYPYVLQQRGWNGDSKGKLYALADRKTGQSMRIGFSEIYVLEASNGNDNTFVVSGTCNLTTYGSTVKAKVFYGQGDGAKNEIISAYCLKMTAFSQSDNQTRIYYGGDIDITQNNNGTVYTWKMGLVGGRIDNVANTGNYTMKPVCWFTAGDYFEIDSATWMYKTKSAYSAAANGTYTYAAPNNQTVNRVKPINGTDIVDFCDNTHNGFTKLYLTQQWDNKTFDVTDPAQRGSVPIGLYNPNDKTNYWGVVTDVAAIEAELTDLTIANTSAVTWNYDLKLLNQKHNAKFDPYCDDFNDNGKCDCVDSLGAPVTDRACSLADTPTEPTLSNPPYYQGQADSSDFETFFNDYGGKSGAQLAGLSMDSLNTAHLYLNLQEVLQCAYKAGTETTYRHPQNYFGNQDFGNLHFEGCPDSNGDVVATTYTANVPTAGGGPVRFINPKPMNNAFDIVRPNTFLTMFQYATKNIGQGITIKSSDKLFGFDEAVALIASRNMLPPKDVVIRRDNTTGSVYNNANLIFAPARLGNNNDVTNVINNVLKGITKPTTLTTAEPDYLYYITHLPSH